MGTSEEFEVVVVGAGFCGVALAAALEHFGVSFVLLEAGPSAGAGFGGHYDRLHLHTPRHRLLHDGDLEQRGNFPMYKSKDDVVRYLNAYCELHGLAEGQQLRFNSPVKQVASAPPTDGWRTGWEVTTADGGVFRAKAVAMCTGAAREPHLPQLPGEVEFKAAGGELLHSRHYTTGERFRGKRVAVVGSGNSGAEICVDLVEHGAEEVTMVVSAPRHFLDLGRMRWVHAVEQWLTSPQQTLSELHHIALGSKDWEENAAGVDAVLKYFTHDLERFGIRKPALGPEQERSRAARQQLDAAPGQARITTAPPRMPTLDVGMVPLLESGAVSVANGRAERLGKEGIAVRQPAEREGGELRWSAVDAVVLATGYRHGLASLLEPSLARSVLTPAAGQELLPLTNGRCQSVAHPSLYFVGWDTTLAFGLSWGHWGWEVGERLRHQLDAARPASARQPKPAPPPPPVAGGPTLLGLSAGALAGVFGVGVAVGVAVALRRPRRSATRRQPTK